MVIAAEATAAWPAYVSAGATVVAVLLAAFAVWYAARQAQRTREEAAALAAEAREQARTERRLQYELGVLAEMSRQHGITGLLHLDGYVRSLIRADSPDEDLPLLRKLADVFPTELGVALDATIDREVEALGAAARGTRDSRRSRAVGREIEEAIDRRMRLPPPG